MLLLAPGLLLAVLAHPLPGQAGTFAGVNMYGHALRIDLLPGALDLEYVLEAPLVRLARESAASGEDGFAERKLAELSDGLQLTLDGAPLAWTAVTVPRPVAPGEAGMVNLTLRRHADLPPAGTLTVRNGNQPDESSLFVADITVHGALVVERSSLVDVENGRIVRNHHAAWIQSEGAREVTLSWRPARWWEEGDAPAPLPVRMAGRVPRPPWHLVAVPAGLVSLAALFALFWRRRRRLEFP